ncbi:MAG: hypothetical protein P8H39_12335 [Thalassotalea sp.]|nr:hypothetical protein [Thalassotalea sp.]
MSCVACSYLKKDKFNLLGAVFKTIGGLPSKPDNQVMENNANMLVAFLKSADVSLPSKKESFIPDYRFLFKYLGREKEIVGKSNSTQSRNFNAVLNLSVSVFGAEVCKCRRLQYLENDGKTEIKAKIESLFDQHKIEGLTYSFNFQVDSKKLTRKYQVSLHINGKTMRAITESYEKGFLKKLEKFLSQSQKQNFDIEPLNSEAKRSQFLEEVERFIGLKFSDKKYVSNIELLHAGKFKECDQEHFRKKFRQKELYELVITMAGFLPLKTNLKDLKRTKSTMLSSFYPKEFHQYRKLFRSEAEIYTGKILNIDFSTVISSGKPRDGLTFNHDGYSKTYKYVHHLPAGKPVWRLPDEYRGIDITKDYTIFYIYELNIVIKKKTYTLNKFGVTSVKTGEQSSESRILAAIKKREYDYSKSHLSNFTLENSNIICRLKRISTLDEKNNAAILLFEKKLSYPNSPIFDRLIRHHHMYRHFKTNPLEYFIENSDSIRSCYNEIEIDANKHGIKLIEVDQTWHANIDK